MELEKRDVKMTNTENTNDNQLPTFSNIKEATSQRVTIDDLFPKAGLNQFGREIRLDDKRGVYTLYYEKQDDGSFKCYSSTWASK